MLQEGTDVGTVLEKQSLVGLEIIFIRSRKVELVIDVARNENSCIKVFVCLFVSNVGIVKIPGSPSTSQVNNNANLKFIQI